RGGPPGYVLDWHCAPRRQYSISLSGTAEIEVGDGTIARVEAGDVVLAEDLTGRGHVTRVIGDRPRLYAIVPFTDTESSGRELGRLRGYIFQGILVGAGRAGCCAGLARGWCAGCA